MSLIVIWIDENIDNEENLKYIKDIISNNSLNVKACKNINDAMKCIKNLKFQETKVIVSGRLYSEFIKVFKLNLNKIFVVPKIIVFTGNKEKFIEYNKEYLNSENKFFTFGGIATLFKDIKEFLKNDCPKTINLRMSEENQSIFEYLDDKDKLILPLFYKSLLDNTSLKNIGEYTNYLYDLYSKNGRIKSLLGPIKSVSNIPIEILSKYYARLFTEESDFYRDINTDLRLKKFEKHLPYIKILYEGVKLQSLPLSNDNILYRGAKMSNDEIKKIINYIKHKKFTVFSKPFLSFYKDKNIAEQFIRKIDKNLSSVLFILEKYDDIQYNLSTHCDMESVSTYPGEKEVLFFPFSSFEIRDIKQIHHNNEKVYEIKLLYLGTLLKDFENEKKTNFSNNILPDSEFKKQLIEFGLIGKEKKEQNNSLPTSIENEYQKYIKEINKEKNIDEKNIIISEVNIGADDINKDIQIINSYENYRRKHETIDDKKNQEYENQKDIKENIEIKINGEKIPFSYMHKFKKEGKYKIEYIFKKKLTKINHMFSGCWKLISLDLSRFNTQNVINMSYLFHDCFSLINLNLSNFNTQNAEKINNMFSGCKSLTDVNLANSHIQNVKDTSNMFYDCNSLKKKILSLKNLKFE